MGMRSTRLGRFLYDGKSIRSRLTLPLTISLVSLVAFWVFTASITIGAGLNLKNIAGITDDIGTPTEAVISALQEERRATVVYLAHQGVDEQSQLTTSRNATDQSLTRYRTHTARAGATASGQLMALVNQLSGLLAGLPAIRDAADRRQLDGAAVIQRFGDISDKAFLIYGNMSTIDDQGIARYSRALITLTRSQEMLSREDALVAGVLIAKRFTLAEYRQFIELSGVQNRLYTDATTDIRELDQAVYQQALRGTAVVRYQGLEDALVSQGAGPGQLTVSGQAWRDATSAAIGELRTLALAGAASAAGRAIPVAVWIILRLAIGAVLGLFVVMVSTWLSVRASRRVIRQLRGLRDVAADEATQLPQRVELLRYGQAQQANDGADNDGADNERVTAIGTPDREVAELATALESMRRIAVETAVQQAELRDGIQHVLMHLARRTQTLVQTQLHEVGQMERQEDEPEELAKLFRIDHLATQMRRQAENLLVLSGVQSGRRWRQSVSVEDVLRSAISEAKDFTRIRLQMVPHTRVNGFVVSEVVHLFAELMDNATSYSPPHTEVGIRVREISRGLAIEIEDKGLGMEPESREDFNQRLADPPRYSTVLDGAQLGLFVVGQIAQRHGIRVSLQNSPYGGTTAVVLLPAQLLDTDGAAANPMALAGSHPES
jgi:signal transduction histidine kinase